MKLITIKKLKKYYGDRLLLDIDKFELAEKDRVGIVGENGVGKTTLIKIIMGKVKADEGSINLTDSYSYISQNEDDYEDCGNSKVKSIFKAPDRYEDYLSGGEKVKIRVVNALSENNSLIIADEPTSNLDRESINILEEMFKKYKGAVLLVSHDRDFLDKICNKIIEINDGKLTCFKGGYSDYLNQKEEDIKVKKREYEKYIHEKARLESVITEKEVLRDRIHKAPKGMGKSEAKTIKMGDQRGKKNIENNIKSVEKRIEHLEVKSSPKEKEKIIININEGTEVSAKNLIEIKDFTLSVGDENLVEDISFNIKNGYKVAIIGENGCGKTTLLNKIVANDVEGINISKSVKIGYFDQSQNILEYKKTILENIKEDSKWDESFIRINLSEFGFKNNSVNKKIEELSGGERVKVAICKIILSNNNLLILDEPTNYLDIKTMEALEDALINTNKTVIVVSHDIRFLSNVCNYIIEIKDNKITEFEGKYADYMESLNKNISTVDKKHKDDELLLLENRLSEVITLLSIESNDDNKKKLDEEYFELMDKIKKIKAELE